MKSTQPETFQSEVLARAGLPEPLQVALRPPTLASSEQTWRELEARLERTRSRRPRTRLYGWMAAVVVLGMLLAGALVRDGAPAGVAKQEQVTPASKHEAPGLALSATHDRPLLLANGDSFRGLSIPENVKLSKDQRTTRFRDGSTLVASPGTVVEPLALTGQKVVLRLSRGRVEVHVVPGGGRTWAIEAGTLSVEVVGTRFSIDRGPRGAQVRVSEGVVLVRSATLEDGVERLAAGEEVSIDDPPNVTVASANARKRPAPVGADQLLREADQARLSGDLGRARTVLETMLSQHSDDPRAALAAYQLALVREQQREPDAAVARAFSTACERAVGSSLKQDCYFRLARAQARAQRRSEAHETARRSLHEFPKGRHAERLRHFLSDGSESP